MRRRFKKKKQPGRFYRLNFRIRAPQLRVIGEDGKQLGVISLREALDKASSLNLDLVEVAPKAKPPVAKIIDFKKFLYLEKKKKKKSLKNAKKSETKQIWLTPFIAEHDFKARIEKGKELLAEGGKLKIVVKFKGRQITRKKFGFLVISKFIEGLKDVTQEKEPRFEGRNLVAIVS